MTTIRVSNRRRFLVIDRDAVTDERLSYRARGLHHFLLAQPDDWAIDSESLAAQAKEGRDAVRSALRELENAGYLVREKKQVEGGRWVTEATLYEVPDDGFPGVGNPTVGEPGPKPLKTVTERTSPTGTARTPTRAVQIAATHLQPLTDTIKRGGSFDLTKMIAKVWGPAWREAEATGIDPNAVGIQIAGFFFQYVTDEPPNWGRIGQLVKRFGKLAIFGIDEAMGHADDPYRYAFRRCQQAAEEHEAKGA